MTPAEKKVIPSADLPLQVRREHVTGLELISGGKVRDTYRIPGHPELILPVTTDRVSVFDFVLPAKVPQKGEILAAINAFWALQLAEMSHQDIVYFGSAIDTVLPDRWRDTPELQKRGTVVRNLEMIPVEIIWRSALTGSGWKAYNKTAPYHLVCGHSLPPNMQDGDRLPCPLFTPTTKAEKGHDEHLDFKEVIVKYGRLLESHSGAIFNAASAVALARGIILADTKLEMGFDVNDQLVLGDERFTPDSSRFWLQKDWIKTRGTGTSPISFDKQFVRTWAQSHGVDKRDPLVEEDIAYVHGLTVPDEILLGTRSIYRCIFWMLTGMRLEKFQQDVMGITTAPQPIDILIGSASDQDQIAAGIRYLAAKGIPYRVHILSCHRNLMELMGYAQQVEPNTTIIAGAGKAAALPGILKTLLDCFGKGHMPVIGVGFHGTTFDASVAARLSIKELPGSPVVMDEDAEPYMGAEGFLLACIAAAEKEFFVPPSQKRPAIFDLDVSHLLKA